MPQLTSKPRKLIIENMILTKSVTARRRKFQTINGFSPAKRTIQQLMIKWQNESTLRNLNKGRSGHPLSQRTSDAINDVQLIINENDTKSTRKIASETGLSRSTVQNILKINLGMKSYSAKVTQELSVSDRTKRLLFCQEMKMIIGNERIDLNEIIFSDESLIHLNGSPNKQNCRKWSNSKPSFNFSVSLHSPKVTVWCGMSSKKIYGPFFFQDN